MLKSKNLVTVLLILGLTLSSSIFFLAKINQGKKETPVIRVWEEQNTLLHLPLYVALDQGFFTQQGIKVDIIRGSNRQATNPYVNKVADLILVDTAEHLYQQSVDPSAPKIIAAIASRDDTFLLARKKEAFSWDQAKEKIIIAYPPETSSGLALEKILRSKELQPMRDVSLYNRIPFDLRMGVFKAGSGDYIQLKGPEAFEAEANKTGYIATALGSRVDNSPSALCAAWPEIIKSNPEAVQAFVNGIYQAQLWLEHEPELGLKAADARFKNYKKAVRSKLLKEYFNLNMWPPQVLLAKKVYGELEDTMYITGQIPTQVPYSNAVEDSFAHNAESTVKYISPDDREKNFIKRIYKKYL